MYTIKRLEEKDFSTMADIAANAYPDFNLSTKEDKDKLIENSIKTQNEHPYVNFYGAFSSNTLVGSMRLHDFKMNLLSQEVKAGGVGFVAVDLLHKKEKVAKEMIEFYLNYYKETGAVMALLYPFRPDFYKNMGFGFGTSMNQFKVKPSKLPNSGCKDHLSYLTIDDATKLCQCYNRYYKKTNGLIEKYPRDFEMLLKNPAIKVVGYKENGEIKGYLVFKFAQRIKDLILSNNIIISYLVYEATEVLEELMTFLHTQDDQIYQVVYNTQDEDFRFLLEDPRDGSDNFLVHVFHQTNLQGTGVMYRVLDVRKLFEQLKEHNFNGVSCKIKLNIKDNLISDNNGSFVIDFKQGYPVLPEDACVDAEVNANADAEADADAEITMDICDFSSLITCVVNLKSLIKYKRAELSNYEMLNSLNLLFASCDKPVCMTQF